MKSHVLGYMTREGKYVLKLGIMITKKLLNFDGLGFDHLNIEIKCDPPLTHSNPLKVSTTPVRFQG